MRLFFLHQNFHYFVLTLSGFYVRSLKIFSTIKEKHAFLANVPSSGRRKGQRHWHLLIRQSNSEQFAEAQENIETRYQKERNQNWWSNRIQALTSPRYYDVDK